MKSPLYPLAGVLLLGAAGLAGYVMAPSYDDTPMTGRNANPALAADASSSGNLFRPGPGVLQAEAGRGAGSSDIAALREEVSQLRSDIAALRRAGGAASTADDTPASLAARNPHGDVQAREEAERMRKKQIAAVETNFRAEPSDPRWSSVESSRIREVLSSAPNGGNFARNIDCHTSICRVELADDGTGSLSKFMPMLAVQVAQTLPNITASQVERGDGTMATVLYMSRK